MAPALQGVRVLDLTHVIAGPFAAYQLALMGADVIKIEPPADPDCVRGRGPDADLNALGLGANYLTQNGNKRALALDLKQDAGKAILMRLVGSADVLIENYRTGALDTLGLGYEDLSRHNAGLVHCSLTGFGEQGGRASVNAYDNVIQAASGLMSLTGTTQTGPTRIGASIIDAAAGMSAAFAIAAALYRRNQGRKGVHIDCSMLEVALSLIGTNVTATLMTGQAKPPAADGEPVESGLGCYRTRDGLLMLGAFNRGQHARMWEGFGRADFAALSDWEAMARHGPSMRVELARRLAERDAAYWEGYFQAIRIPAERVRTLDQAIALNGDRPFVQSVSLADGRRIDLPTAPFRWSEDGPRLDTPPPAHGADSDVILAELGFSDAEIVSLRQQGAIA